jgi:hypothetical protein
MAHKRWKLEIVFTEDKNDEYLSEKQLRTVIRKILERELQWFAVEEIEVELQEEVR